jgi:murein DD-endopeptidase MepM/ murein hydrolase activator NlpD
MKILFVSTKKSKTSVVSFSKRYIIPGLTVFVVSIIVITKVVSDRFVINEQKEEVSRLQNKNKALMSELAKVNNNIAYVQNIIKDIQKRDDMLRHEAGLKKIDKDVRKLAIGGSDKEYYFDDNLDDETKILKKQNDLLYELERQLKFELESYKKVTDILARKEDSLQYIPLITPIPEDVYRVSDQFGLRMHPILKKIKRHHGIDLACEQGTPVYATADGYVTFSGNNGAYGKFIKIQHKSKDRKIDPQYETRYGHLFKKYVTKGQFVRRGDIIAEVGSTGRSTAPHLHYEVRYKSKSLEPSEYYFLNF